MQRKLLLSMDSPKGAFSCALLGSRLLTRQISAKRCAILPIDLTCFKRAARFAGVWTPVRGTRRTHSICDCTSDALLSFGKRATQHANECSSTDSHPPQSWFLGLQGRAQKGFPGRPERKALPLGTPEVYPEGLPTVAGGRIEREPGCRW